MRSICPLVWFRLCRLKIFPWVNLAIASWHLIRTCGSPSEATRFAIALAKLDHLGLISLLNDCLW
ncbi:hypothetical protein HJG54_25530 [Leptolyngbya sp. NK1-12]|uniref:Uncharacterized protein n=1 Tax=Leptolyngbya sp. NK1-12 TaxID=2547451 RepID=A0AA97AHU2_9CYAN|nr:hypothetical protein [Leptolyngbya sp. NK1-12]WNZ25860.1 hypothetical protein HJG54_25530 [Leptolyngbya sp. NK1-12]